MLLYRVGYMRHDALLACFIRVQDVALFVLRQTSGEQF